MRVFEIQVNGATQWVASATMQEAINFIDSLVAIDGTEENDEPFESLYVENIPDRDWDKKWIADEDNPGEHYSIRHAMSQCVSFPNLLATEE